MVIDWGSLNCLVSLDISSVEWHDWLLYVLDLLLCRIEGVFIVVLVYFISTSCLFQCYSEIYYLVGIPTRSVWRPIRSSHLWLSNWRQVHSFMVHGLIDICWDVVSSIWAHIFHVLYFQSYYSKTTGPCYRGCGENDK